MTVRNLEYIASGEYDGEFYLIEKLDRNHMTISRHSDGKAVTCTYKGVGFTGLTDLRRDVAMLGELKIVTCFAKLTKYGNWGPMYDVNILRDSESAKAFI